MTKEETQELTITTGDLQVVAQVIAAGSQRGAFRAHELAVVGATFNKVMAILEAQNAVPKLEGTPPAAEEKKE